MTSLQKVVSIVSNGEEATDLFICDTCRENNNHTIVPEPETKDGVCEWKLHA